MTRRDLKWGILFIVALLASCGGGGSGGGSSGSNSAASASTLSFPLQSSLSKLVAKGSSTFFSISGSCSGTGSVVDAPPVAATFEGAASQSTLTTITMSYTNCVPLSSITSETSYFDSNFNQLGSVAIGNNYGVFSTPATFPAEVKVGDLGTIGTVTLYTDSTKTVVAGKDVSTYAVEADTANSAIINLVSESYNSGGVLTSTEQKRYRILADGTMTPISWDIQYANGSTTHLILTVVSPPATPILGGWGVPAKVSDALVAPSTYSDPKITGDAAGNMILATPFGVGSQVEIAGYQKPAGQNWGAQFALSQVKTTTASYLSNYIEPQLQSDSAGNAVAAWVGFDNTAPSDRNFTSHVYVRNYDKVNGWGAQMLLQSVPTEYATSINLTVQGDGTGWLVWKERTFKDPSFSTNDQFALFAAEYVPSTGWGIPEKITGDYLYTAGGDGLTGRIATENKGNPMVLWSNGPTLYATNKVAGIWGTAQVVANTSGPPGTINPFSKFDLAIDGSGNAIAVWPGLAATGLTTVVYSNRYVAGTGWGQATVMPTVTSQNALYPKLAMDTAGNALLLWSEYDGSLATAIWAKRFDHVLGWQAPTIISSPPSKSLEDSSFPQIGFDAIGNAVAIWQKYDAMLNKQIVRACRYDHSLGWGENVTISSGSGTVDHPQMAVSADGHATAMWLQDDVGNLSYKLWSNDFAP